MWPCLLGCIIIVIGQLLQVSVTLTKAANRSFTIDYENDQFLKDGVPFRYLSGSMHYFRVPAYYWKDRFLKMRAAGLVAVQTFVPWNVHEPHRGRYDFSGRNNITAFFETAAEVGFYVILRTSPYSCGDVDYGGLPSWLNKIDGIKTRTADPRYLNETARWYKKFFPMVLPYLYKNGGPIISIQIENEYAYAPYCSHEYMKFLRDLFRSYVGDDVVLFTVDGYRQNLACGTIEGVYPTVDFGPMDTAAVAFAVQRKYAPKGPLVCTEYYPGWGSQWAYPYHHGDTDSLIAGLGDIYRMNASLNFYMFEGGTNFGYQNAGVTMKPYSSILQTYDYDSPLTENGDTTPKYFAIRAAFEALSGKPIPYPVPPNVTRVAYGRTKMALVGRITDFLPNMRVVTAEDPISFEHLDFPYGFVLYEHDLTINGANLTITQLCDLGYVMLDDDPVLGTLTRDGPFSIMLTAVRPGSKLRILVENRGRNQAGWYQDPKGILGNVTLDGQVLKGWNMYLVDLDALAASDLASAENVPSLPINRRRQASHRVFYRHRQRRLRRSFKASWEAAATANGFSPSIYVGTLNIGGDPEDTFFDPTGWGKGQVFINGQNLGRYWPLAGPQITLWVPKPWLRRGQNSIFMFELEKAPTGCGSKPVEECFIDFIDRANLHPPFSKTNLVATYSRFG